MDIRNSNNQSKNHTEEGQKKVQGNHHKKKKLTNLLTLLVVLTILAVAGTLGVRVFGSVDMSSSGFGGNASDGSSTTDTVPAAVSSAGATPAAASSATAKTASGGHYIQPDGSEWYLKLVNPWNQLSSSYPLQLTTYFGDKQYDQRAIDSLRKMISAGSAYGLAPASLYRSAALQTTLFNREVAAYKNQGYSQAKAEAAAANVVARPWTSEHNLGLAADILGSGYSSLEVSFDTTPAYRWLKSHCAEYGFILRYPKDKIDVTGVQYEPWHYRYVGVEAATEIMSRGITLEEYLQEKGK